MTSNNANQ